MAFPAIVGAADKAGSKPPIVGSDAFTYEADHEWGRLPDDIKYGNTHGICQDAQGYIYIHHTVHKTSRSPNSMVVFDENGQYVRSWGAMYKGGAHGLHISKEGNEEFLYLCDQLHGIVTKRTLRGEEVWTLGYPAESEAYKLGSDGQRPPYRPTNMAIAPNGDIFVSDGYGSSYINQYSAKGEFIRTFGGLGSGPGQLSRPHGIWVDTRSKTPVLIVADRSNSRLQTFSLQGEHIGFVGGVKLPCHFHNRQDILLVPDLAARVTLMDRSNNVITHLGEGPENFRERREPPFPTGQFISPHSACFDKSGNIFVVEYVPTGRVTKLRKTA